MLTTTGLRTPSLSTLTVRKLLISQRNTWTTWSESTNNSSRTSPRTKSTLSNLSTSQSSSDQTSTRKHSHTSLFLRIITTFLSSWLLLTKKSTRTFSTSWSSGAGMGLRSRKTCSTLSIGQPSMLTSRKMREHTGSMPSSQPFTTSERTNKRQAELREQRDKLRWSSCLSSTSSASSTVGSKTIIAQSFRQNIQSFWLTLRHANIFSKIWPN